MANETGVLTADFPRAVRGYSPIAVDDFVRQLGERLDEMQAKLTEQNDRVGKLHAELTRANDTLAAFAKKESAISSGVISIEQRKVAAEIEITQQKSAAEKEIEEQKTAAEHEVEEFRGQAEIAVAELLERARTEAEVTVRSARETADTILSSSRVTADEAIETARAEADEITSAALAAAEHHAERLRSLCADYDETASHIRRTLEAQLALLPAPGTTLKTLSMTGIAVTSSVDSQSRELAEAA